LLGREFRLEGQYRYGDRDNTQAGTLYGKKDMIKEEDVFPVPARPVLQQI